MSAGGWVAIGVAILGACTLILLFAPFFRAARRPGNNTVYDFDKNPPRSLFAEPEAKTTSLVQERVGRDVVVRGKHMGEDVEWVMTRHATPGRPMFPENEARYTEVFAKRGSRWVKQKR